MEAEAKHDFQATAEDELSFPKNAILKVRTLTLIKITVSVANDYTYQYNFTPWNVLDWYTEVYFTI